MIELAAGDRLDQGLDEPRQIWAVCYQEDLTHPNLSPSSNLRVSLQLVSVPLTTIYA